MAEKVLVICPTRQARQHAACWRDGQMAHGMHARIARRARSIALDVCSMMKGGCVFGEQRMFAKEGGKSRR
jgi:hypothetical protein